MADFLDNNKQLPSPSGPASFGGEQIENSSSMESLPQQAQYIFEQAESPFELTQQFNQLKSNNVAISGTES